MQDYEIRYASMVREVMIEGTKKQTRNGETASLFGMSLEVDDLARRFPLIQGRKMYPKGVLGEFAAMIRGPKHIDDFKKWGCNFWEKWANKDGSINVDYGNAWFDFEGFDQIAQLKDSLINNPNDRRMIVSSWRPHAIKDLNLPCCHYSYQFHVSNGELNMIWTQRSVDMMIGLPSDIILAAIWVITLANEVGLKPGKVKMDFGDCHVYEEHYEQALKYVNRVLYEEHLPMKPLTYKLDMDAGEDFCMFEPDQLVLSIYQSLEPMKLELKA